MMTLVGIVLAMPIMTMMTFGQLSFTYAAAVTTSNAATLDKNFKARYETVKTTLGRLEVQVMSRPHLAPSSYTNQEDAPLLA